MGQYVCDECLGLDRDGLAVVIEVDTTEGVAEAVTALAVHLVEGGEITELPVYAGDADAAREGADVDAVRTSSKILAGCPACAWWDDGTTETGSGVEAAWARTPALFCASCRAETPNRGLVRREDDRAQHLVVVTDDATAAFRVQVVDLADDAREWLKICDLDGDVDASVRRWTWPPTVPAWVARAVREGWASGTSTITEATPADVATLAEVTDVSPAEVTAWLDGRTVCPWPRVAS